MKNTLNFLEQVMKLFFASFMLSTLIIKELNITAKALNLTICRTNTNLVSLVEINVGHKVKTKENLKIDKANEQANDHGCGSENTLRITINHCSVEK